jgi:actin-related protein
LVKVSYSQHPAHAIWSGASAFAEDPMQEGRVILSSQQYDEEGPEPTMERVADKYFSAIN